MGKQPYGEWAVGLGIRVVLADGTVKSWSDERPAVGLELDARSIAASRLRATVKLDYPDAQVDVLALSTRLVIDHFPG